MSRAEVDLQNAVKKACNNDEVPPKRKHVRACIVYTWDHKNSRAFWNAVKIQPLQQEEVPLFKALIMIHKVLQEGHPNTLKDGYRNRDFIALLGKVFPSRGTPYGRLISQYDKFILQKLDFHRNNPGFNGTFEYEEYVSLRAVNDPNEGYELLLQLMDMQDAIADLQKLIFATIHQTLNNLCKVSALVPLIAESYGIYKFCTLMLRAMYQQLGEDELLQALFERYDSQFFALRDFYTDCHSIKFLTSLIQIPKLPGNPPSLKVTDLGQAIEPPAPALPQRQVSEAMSVPPPQSPPPEVNQLHSQQTGWLNAQMEEQERIQQQLELQRQQQLQEQLRQQQLFEEQQRQQQLLLQQQQHALQQQQTSNANRVSELEHDLLMFKNQYDNDQNLLLQYDLRVKLLETELQNFNNNATQQLASKDEQVKNLEEQINNWTKKYEKLAKLYSQLRGEHLNLLEKFKKIQQKINLAQELIQKKEKYEKDLKAKNLELADLIRERDRARLDLDRLKGVKDQEIEKLQAQIRELQAQHTELGKLQYTHLRSMEQKHSDEISALKRQLMDKGDYSDLQQQLKDKEVDLEIAQESLDLALKQLALASASKGDDDEIVNEQIDQIILLNIAKIKHLLDVFLNNNIKRIQEIKAALILELQAGNMNTLPEFLMSVIELCANTSNDFSNTFIDFIVEDKAVYAESQDSNLTYSRIIVALSELTDLAQGVMLNAKGFVSNLVRKLEEGKVIGMVKDVLDELEKFFADLNLEKLDSFEDEDDRYEVVIEGNVRVQQALHTLGDFIDGASLAGKLNKLADFEHLVDNEMATTAKNVHDAQAFLLKLLQMLAGDVHEALIAAAKAITDAVAILITCATESQREIVAKTKGQLNPAEFYRKNSRWTEGLISASKAVGGATNILITTADGVLRNKNSHEELIVALNEVAALTAQLVAASRVKANFTSKTQDNLELASSGVLFACKLLVLKVQLLLQKKEDDYDIDLDKLTTMEGKKVEMEQQVEILKLENKLASARKRLGEIRRYGYRDDNTDDEDN